MYTDLLQHPFLQQALLFSGHDKVVRVILVVHDVLQVNACLLLEIQEELLVENEGHTRDLLHTRLCICVSVDEVGSDRNGQLAPELLPFETCIQPGVFIAAFCSLLNITHVPTPGNANEYTPRKPRQLPMK